MYKAPDYIDPLAYMKEPQKVKKANVIEQDVLNKLFVGNVPKLASSEEIKKFMVENDKKVKEIALMKDPVNPNGNRGFGFVLMETIEDADNLLLTQLPLFHGKQLDFKRAAPKICDDPLVHTKTYKVFVSGLDEDCTEETLEEFFNEKYGNLGKVTEASIKKDKSGKICLGCGFITFDSFNIPDKIIAENNKPTIKNKQILVRKVESGTPTNGGSGYSPSSKDIVFEMPNSFKKESKTQDRISRFHHNAPYSLPQSGVIGNVRLVQTIRNTTNPESIVKERPSPNLAVQRLNPGFVNRPVPSGYTSMVYNYTSNYDQMYGYGVAGNYGKSNNQKPVNTSTMPVNSYGAPQSGYSTPSQYNNNITNYAARNNGENVPQVGVSSTSSTIPHVTPCTNNTSHTSNNY